MTIKACKKYPMTIVTSYVLHIVITAIIYNGVSLYENGQIVLFIGLLLCALPTVFFVNFCRALAKCRLKKGHLRLLVKNTKKTLIVFWFLSVISYVILYYFNVTEKEVGVIAGLVIWCVLFLYFYMNRFILDYPSMKFKVYKSRHHVSIDVNHRNNSKDLLLSEPYSYGSYQESSIEKVSLSISDDTSSFDDMNVINPATGAPMVGVFDTFGNPYGMDTDSHHYNQDDFHHNDR